MFYFFFFWGGSLSFLLDPITTYNVHDWHRQVQKAQKVESAAKLLQKAQNDKKVQKAIGKQGKPKPRGRPKANAGQNMDPNPAAGVDSPEADDMDEEASEPQAAEPARASAPAAAPAEVPESEKVKKVRGYHVSPDAPEATTLADAWKTIATRTDID